MISQATLIMVDKKVLTLDDWCRMIDSRRAVIGSDIEGFAQTEIGEAQYKSPHNEWVRRVSEGISIKLVRQGTDSFDLKTRGVFLGKTTSKLTGVQDGQPSYEILLGGISRKGDWLLVRMTEEYVAQPSAGCFAPYNRQVEISRASLNLLLHVTGLAPAYLFLELGEIIKRYAGRKQELARKALEKKYAVEFEDALLREQLRLSNNESAIA